MNATTLHQHLMEVTLANSQFEERRDYVSLSGIINDVATLIGNYKFGYSTDVAGHLKCRMGYFMEGGLKARLALIPGIAEHPAVIVPGSNGLIKGHPDLSYYGYPCDCKSFLADDHMPDGIEKRIPAKIYWQMQGYMMYANKEKSYIICESRQTGMVKVLEVLPNRSIQLKIQDKVRLIQKLLSEKPVPLVTT